MRNLTDTTAAFMSAMCFNLKRLLVLEVDPLWAECLAGPMPLSISNLTQAYPAGPPPPQVYPNPPLSTSITSNCKFQRHCQSFNRANLFFQQAHFCSCWRRAYGKWRGKYRLFVQEET